MLNHNWQEYTHGPIERCGVVLKNGVVIEIKNTHPTPEKHFRMLEVDVKAHEGDIQATWHTHLSKSYNLSLEDFECFMSLPNITHLIISFDGVARYQVHENTLINLGRRVF